MPEHSCPAPLTSGLSSTDKQRVVDAFCFAAKHLSTLRRRTDASYAKHGTKVALVVREVSADPALLSVALLHDMFLLPDAEAIAKHSPLSGAERQLARLMHDLRRLHIHENTHDLDRVIAAFSSDERLLILRMAHRLNDIRNLSDFAPHLRLTIARETLYMYTSIAGRLGMHAWRHEMEEICFRFLQPKSACMLERHMQLSLPLDLVCIRHAKQFILRTMRTKNIPCDMSHRIKGLYATYRKMILKNRKFEELTDRLALRLIVPTVEDCYRTLGIIHALFHPIPGKLKDYIGAPKENGYRSIHTVVFPLRGVTEQPMEIQIRTEEMHEECEFGFARHADYKHYLYALRRAPARVNLFKNLLTLRAETRSPKQFAKALRTYFDEGHIAVFDEKNNLYHMKKPVTADQFIRHTRSNKKQAKLASVRINGRKSAKTAILHDGDTVEAQFRRVKS